MKKTVLTLAAALTLAATASAYAPKSAPLDAAAPLKLVPRKVVHPTNLPLNFRGDTVEVQFSVDAAGRPRNIEIVSRVDAAVRERIAKAVSQWEFDPAATKTGTRYVLPLEIRMPRA
jgi:TonB family protein